MVVVLIGAANREEFDMLADAVARRGAEAVVWDTRDWPSDRPVTYDVETETVTVEESYDVTDVTGVFLWAHQLFRPRLPRFADDVETDGLRHTVIRLDSWRGVFNSLLPVFERHGATVFTRPWAQHYHDLKPFQVSQFAAEDVPVPATLVTSDPERARAFVDRHGEVVYKPVTGGAAPSRLTAAELTDAKLDRLANAPVQFQEYVPGEDVRVYFLDDEVIAASEYVTDAWSHKTVEGDPADAERVHLRPAVREAVERAATRSPLQFGAADVRLTDDSFALLELNPGPRFAFHDRDAKTDVAGRIADALV